MISPFINWLRQQRVSYSFPSHPDEASQKRKGWLSGCLRGVSFLLLYQEVGGGGRGESGSSRIEEEQSLTRKCIFRNTWGIKINCWGGTRGHLFSFQCSRKGATFHPSFPVFPVFFSFCFSKATRWKWNNFGYLPNFMHPIFGPHWRSGGLKNLYFFP